MLRDDDLLSSLRMARPVGASGSHLPGGGTEVRIGLDSPSGDGEMVAHHESAHLELNYVTGFGLVLRAVGSHLIVDATSDAEEQLAGLVGLCRNTHEIFATTTGVWRSRAPFDTALASYPTYRPLFAAGRELAGSLLDGSFAAHTAMMTACWAAMQPPVGALLAAHDLSDLTADEISEEFRPDVRMNHLLRAKLDPATVDVALPDNWRRYEMRNAQLDVTRLHETFVAVASAYYEAFAEILVGSGFPTYAFDGHKSDPALHQWLEGNPSPLAEPIHFRPELSGSDRFWPVTLSDGERVIVHERMSLVAVHLGDLPATVEGKSVGVDSLVQGSADDSSILIVVRPVRTLLTQYDVGEASASLLRAAASDGVVIGVRADLETSTGERVGILAVLSSQKQLDALAALPSRHGVLASVSEACSWFPNWSQYWTAKLASTTHAVRMADVPRRLWIDGLAADGLTPRCQPFSIGEDRADSALAGLLVWFDETYNPADPPFLLLGSRRTVIAVSSALQTIFGSDSLVSTPPPESDKMTAIVRRVIECEPWLDARSIENLPDFAKMGHRYADALRRAIK